MIDKPIHDKCNSIVFLGIITCIIAMFTTACLLVGCEFKSELKRVDLKNVINEKELGQIKPKRDPNVFLFGFDLRATPEEDAKQYLPFLKYLENATGYRFTLRFTSKHKDIVQILGTGEVDFAAIGAGSYLRAHQEHDVIPVARGVNSLGKGEYQSMIIVRPDSGLREIKDLRGRRFAFGGINSTQGHIIPRIMLAEQGLGMEDLGSYEFTGSHFECANSVTSGRFDAGGIQDTMGRELATRGLVKILHTSRYFPSSGISANRNVPIAVLTAVKRALLDFQPTGRDAEPLYHWDMTEMPNGFIEAKDEDYEEFRKWAVKLNLISNFKVEERRP